MKNKKSQSGVVLLLVLMILALASVLSADLIKNAINNTKVALSDSIHSDIEQVLLGGEAWAMSRLSEIKQADQVIQYKDPSAPWILDISEFESDLGGVVRTTLVNRSSCIDVNGLFDEGHSKLIHSQLTTLSKNLGIDPNWIQQLNGYQKGLSPRDEHQSESKLHYLELTLVELDASLLATIYPYICFNSKRQATSITSQSIDTLEALLPNSNKTELDKVIESLVLGSFDATSFDKLIATDNANDQLKFSSTPTYASVRVEYLSDSQHSYLYSDLTVDAEGLVSPLSRSFQTEQFHNSLFSSKQL